MSNRILSIQSHVAYGYVGGKAAVFPLQCLGFDVDAVNTVDFSNHSGYGRFGGSKASAQDLTTIFDTMEANGLLSQQRLLTGYIPGAEALSVIAVLARKLKARNPEMIYLLDPVLGDSGKLYVPPDVIPIYRELLPQATIITPNWFEVETLTNTTLVDIPSLRRALKILHEEHSVPHVVMSSMPLRDFLRDALPANLLPVFPENAEKTNRQLLATSAESEDEIEEKISTVHAHVLPCIPGYFSGVGDLFSALVLAHFYAYPASASLPTPLPTLSLDAAHTPLSLSASLALSKTFAILQLTHAHVSALPPFPSLSASGATLTLSPTPSITEDATDEERDLADPERRVRRMRTRELRIVQGQDLLRATPTLSPSPNVATVAEFREMRVWEGFWARTPMLQ